MEEIQIASMVRKLEEHGSQPDAMPVHQDKMTGEEFVLFARLKLAAVRLRDAELELRQAHEQYKKALDAFNRHVAPVEGK